MLSCERARLARLIVRSHPTLVLRNERSQRTRTTVEGATGHVREAAWCHPTDRTFSPTRFQIHGDLYLLMRFTICSSFLTLMVPRDGSYCPSTAQYTLATSTRNLTKISRLPLTLNPRGLVTVLWRSWQTNIVMPSFVAPQHPRHAPSSPLQPKHKERVLDLLGIFVGINPFYFCDGRHIVRSSLVPSHQRRAF